MYCSWSFTGRRLMQTEPSDVHTSAQSVSPTPTSTTTFYKPLKQLILLQWTVTSAARLKLPLLHTQCSIITFTHWWPCLEMKNSFLHHVFLNNHTEQTAASLSQTVCTSFISHTEAVSGLRPLWLVVWKELTCVSWHVILQQQNNQWVAACSGFHRNKATSRKEGSLCYQTCSNVRVSQWQLHKPWTQHVASPHLPAHISPLSHIKPWWKLTV